MNGWSQTALIAKNGMNLIPLMNFFFVYLLFCVYILFLVDGIAIMAKMLKKTSRRVVSALLRNKFRPCSASWICIQNVVLVARVVSISSNDLCMSNGHIKTCIFLFEINLYWNYLCMTQNYVHMKIQNRQRKSIAHVLLMARDNGRFCNNAYGLLFLN